MDPGKFEAGQDIDVYRGRQTAFGNGTSIYPANSHSVLSAGRYESFIRHRESSAETKKTLVFRP